MRCKKSTQQQQYLKSHNEWGKHIQAIKHKLGVCIINHKAGTNNKAKIKGGKYSMKSITLYESTYDMYYSTTMILNLHNLLLKIMPL